MFTPARSAQIKEITDTEIIVRVKPKYLRNKKLALPYLNPRNLGRIAERLAMGASGYTLMNGSDIHVLVRVTEARLDEEELENVYAVYKQYRLSLELFPQAFDVRRHVMSYMQYWFNRGANLTSNIPMLRVTFSNPPCVISISNANGQPYNKFRCVTIREDQDRLFMDFVSSGTCNTSNVVERLKENMQYGYYVLAVPRQSVEVTRAQEEAHEVRRGVIHKSRTDNIISVGPPSSMHRGSPVIAFDDYIADYKTTTGKPGAAKTQRISSIKQVKQPGYSSQRFTEILSKALSSHNISTHTSPEIETKTHFGLIEHARCARTPHFTELKLVVHSNVTAAIRKRTTTQHKRYVKFHKGVLLVIDGFNPAEYSQLIVGVSDPHTGGGSNFVVPTTNWFAVENTEVCRLADRKLEELQFSYRHNQHNKYHKTPFHFASMSNALVGKFIPRTPEKDPTAKYVPIVYIERINPQEDLIRSFMMASLDGVIPTRGPSFSYRFA